MCIIMHLTIARRSRSYNSHMANENLRKMFQKDLHICWCFNFYFRYAPECVYYSKFTSKVWLIWNMLNLISCTNKYVIAMPIYVILRCDWKFGCLFYPLGRCLEFWYCSLGNPDIRQEALQGSWRQASSLCNALVWCVALLHSTVDIHVIESFLLMLLTFVPFWYFTNNTRYLINRILP